MNIEPLWLLWFSTISLRALYAHISSKFVFKTKWIACGQGSVRILMYGLVLPSRFSDFCSDRDKYYR